MHYHEAMQEMTAGILKPLYLLHGTDEYMMSEVIGALRRAICAPETEAFNYQAMEPGPSQLSDGLGLCQTMPFFAERRLVVLRDVPALGGGKRKKADSSDHEEEPAANEPTGDDATDALLRYVANPVPFTTLVLTAGESLDTRRRVSKALMQAATVVECKPLREAEAAGWAQSHAGKTGSRMSLETATLLVDKVGTDLRALSTELGKLQLFVGEGKEIRSKDVEALVPGSGQSNIFELVDALGDKAASDALRVLDTMLLFGEPPLRILFMVTRQIRMILLTRAMEARRVNPKEAAARAGVPPFLYQKLQRQARRFGRAELVGAMQRLLKADLALKSSQDPTIVLQTLIIELAG